jgi:hypothetical protein
MRWMPSGLIATLALGSTACSSWYRAGPQVRTIDGRLAVEGKATIEGGVEQMLFPLALSGGVTPEDGEDVFALETGGEWIAPIGDDTSWAYVAGPRFVGMLSGPSGTSLGLNAGPMVELAPESRGQATVLSLELFAGGGLSGDMKNGFIGGATLSIGWLHRGIFRIPSGRVLRVAGGVVTARAISRSDWCDELTVGELPFAERMRQGREWLDAALDEHASIAAFAKLHAELTRLRAPERLVVETLRAARDEERHARLCFSIASAYLGRSLGPGSLRLPASRADEVPSLPRIAREALVDGCFGEGLAAELARARSERARDPVIRAALTQIARDEARHAEHGWQTLVWCLENGGREVECAVDDALHEVAMTRPESQSSFSALVATAQRVASERVFRRLG